MLVQRNTTSACCAASHQAQARCALALLTAAWEMELSKELLLQRSLYWQRAP